MKNSNKLIALAFSMFGFAFAANAQSTATATSTATVVAPITITKNADMNFGNVAVSASTAGTVVLTPEAGRSITGGVTLPASTGTVAAAKFTVSGEGTYTYSITLPSTAHTIKHGTSLSTMTVNAFTSTPSATGTLTAGTQALTVGATLNVGAAQEAGTYTSGTGFDVTVNYN